ncbi:beta-glucosidase A [Diaporthe helianthi]|uniref:Beta-glucosidase A n=1 Tax=Diaporthe helianthi TaxID=158607 RepID=A0A2P5I5S3_DIAHE|nr:beta-glucosidase A [Diaporthe helianthi]
MLDHLLLLGVAGSTLAQQVYVPANGTVPRPQCSSSSDSALYATASPTYAFSTFSFTQTETVRTATSLKPSATIATYAPPYESLSHLLPNLSTTTWGNWYPDATASATDNEDPYGQAAWSALWERASVANFTTRGIYSTTVSPTPIPTSELVFPPPDYFTPQDCYTFPKGFMFGVAGSAAQIEGAIADEGRSPGVLELLSPSTPNYVANENYYLYKQDIERLASIGVKYYSFSISWGRILPFSLEGSPVNQQGLDHYDDLINFVVEKGMQPLVTLIHFDTPLTFLADPSQVGGSLVLGFPGGYDNATFEDAFVHYGKVVMTHYADRVPVWFTYNEPFVPSPNGKSFDTVIKSHARLAHFYREELNGTGQIALKFNNNFGVPRDPLNEDDVNAAYHFNDLQIATFGNPFFLGKDYPEALKMTFPDYVPLTQEDLEYINGTADFVGIDPYTATVVSPPSHGIETCAANTSDPLYPLCVNMSTLTTTGWNIGYRSQSYVFITPKYLRTYLNWLWNTFRYPIVLTEFGFPEFGESSKAALSDQLFDSVRSNYYTSYMSEVLKSIWEDGVNVAGAFAWSFMDNWEFGSYNQQFGIQTVNRTTQERRFKKSFFDLLDFVATRTQE